MNSNPGSSTEKFSSTVGKVERLDRDPFLDIGLKVPETFEKLSTIVDKKVQSMMDKGWDTGNDPDKLSMFQRWHSFKSKFNDEQVYLSYLRDKKIPLLQEFILSIDLGGWIKKDRLFVKLNHLANILNLEMPLAQNLFEEEIKRQNIELRSIAPAPSAIKDLQARVFGDIGQKKVELTWTSSSDCSNYIICRGPSETPPSNPRQGRIKMIPNTVNSYVHECSEQDVGLAFTYIVFAFRQEDNQSTPTSIEVQIPGELSPNLIRSYQEYQDVVIEWQSTSSCNYYCVKIRKNEYKTQVAQFRYRPEITGDIEFEITAIFLNGLQSPPISGNIYFEKPPPETPEITLDVSQDNISLHWKMFSQPNWTYSVLRSLSADFKDAKVIWQGVGSSLQDPLDIVDFELRCQHGIVYYYAIAPYHEVLCPFSGKQIFEKMTLHHAGPILIPREVGLPRAEQKQHQIELTWKNASYHSRCHIFKSTTQGLPKIVFGDTIEPGPNTIYCGCVVEGEVYSDDSPHNGVNCYLIIADYGTYGLAPGVVATANFFTPPGSPLEFIGNSKLYSISLQWKRPDTFTTSYLLYRSKCDETEPIVLAHISNPNQTSYEDRVQGDDKYMYYLFSQNQEISCVTPSQTGPCQAYLDVRDVNIITRARMIEFHWKAPESCEKVFVYRQNELGRDSIVNQSDRSSYIANDGIAGKTYQYRISCVYQNIDGTRFETPGVIRQVMFTDNHPSLTQFTCHHLGKSVVLSWEKKQTPGDSHSVIILASRNLYEMLPEMTLDEFTNWRLQNIVEEVFLENECSTLHKTTEKKLYYYPIILQGGRIYTQKPVECQCIPEISGTLRGTCHIAEISGISLEWDWDKDLQEVRLIRTQGQYAQGPYDFSGKVYETSIHDYFLYGYFYDPDLPPQPDGQLYYYTIYRKNAEQYSPGMQENCRVAILYANARMQIDTQVKGKKTYFIWHSIQNLSSIQKLAKGDFYLAYSNAPSIPSSWTTIPESHNNIFLHPEGEHILPILPKNTLIKIVWSEIEDNRWFQIWPWSVQL